MALPPGLQNSLLQMQAASLGDSWNIPSVVTPLTSEELAHLFNHPIARDVMPSRVAQDTFIQSFVQQLLTGLVTECVMSESTTQNQQYDQLSDRVELLQEFSELSLEEVEAAEVELQRQSRAGEHEVMTESQSSPAQTHDEIPSKTGKDPSVEVMKKTAVSKAKGLLVKGIKESVLDLTKNDPVARRLAMSALKGAAVGAQIGAFATSAAEKGFVSATVDLTKDTFISTASKYVAKGLVKIVGLSNPATAAVVLGTVIGDLFKATETAPSSIDMYPERQTTTSAPSQLPELQHYPAFQPLK